MSTRSNDYRRAGIRPVWCPGCGHYSVLKALQAALSKLEIKPENVMLFSGIGCSGRFSHYLNTYSLHGTHGRALPTATGAKTVRPEMTVLAVGGDGDSFGIGGGHIAPAARRNVDLTYLILDNQTYGLTKGQASPTTPPGIRTKTSPYGSYEEPIEPVLLLLACGASFVARASSLDAEELAELAELGISHRGFAVIHVLSPCETFPVLDRRVLRERLLPLPADHDASDRAEAISLACQADRLYTGVFFRMPRPALDERLEARKREALSSYTGPSQSRDEGITLERIISEFS